MQNPKNKWGKIIFPPIPITCAHPQKPFFGWVELFISAVLGLQNYQVESAQSHLYPFTPSLSHYQHPIPTWCICHYPWIARTQNHHPKVTVYIRFHSWCCMFSGFWQMSSDLYLLPSSTIKNSFIALKNPLCSTYSFLPSTNTPATTDLLLSPIVLPFYRVSCSWNDIVYIHFILATYTQQYAFNVLSCPPLFMFLFFATLFVFTYSRTSWMCLGFA
jgi:hypothetical protein